MSEIGGLFQMQPSTWPTATPEAPTHGWVPDESETEMTETTYTREDMARAWQEGRESEWQTRQHIETGDGEPGDPNPYEEDA